MKKKRRNPHKRITALKAMELLAFSHRSWNEEHILENIREALREHVKHYLWKGVNR